MTFLTLQQETENRLSNYDLTISNDATKIKRWINMAIQYICGKRLWPFQLAEDIVQTITDITTGTVSVNANDTAITFSSAPSVSVANRFIQFSTTEDWYKITAHTASDTAATISPAYVDSSNLTSGTYIVRKLLYTTSTPLIQIIDMKQMVTPFQMISQDPRLYDYFLPLYTETGSPYHYIMSSPDSSGNAQFSLYPSPDTVLNLMVRGIRALTDLSADGDVPFIPTPWQDAIVNIACYYGFQGLDDTRAKEELLVGESRIKDMAMNLTHDLGRHRVMNPSVEYDHNQMGRGSLPYVFRLPVS